MKAGQVASRLEPPKPLLHRLEAWLRAGCMPRSPLPGAPAPEQPLRDAARACVHPRNQPSRRGRAPLAALLCPATRRGPLPPPSPAPDATRQRGAGCCRSLPFPCAPRATCSASTTSSRPSRWGHALTCSIPPSLTDSFGFGLRFGCCTRGLRCPCMTPVRSPPPDAPACLPPPALPPIPLAAPPQLRTLNRERAEMLAQAWVDSGEVRRRAAGPRGRGFDQA